MLDRNEEALVLEREVYDKSVQMCKLDGYETLVSGLNRCCTLVSLKKFDEARPFLRKLIGRSRRVLGPEHINTLRLRRAYADSYFSDDAASAREVREAVTTLEELDALARRVYGEGHAYRLNIYASLKRARRRLAGVENKG